jgi:pyruvyltransferase
LAVRLFWSKGFRMGHGNFGDVLGTEILSFYGLTPIWSPPIACQMISVGSIIQNVGQTFNGFVLGSGLIQDRPYPLPKAKFLAVRGALTRELVNAPPQTPLGDLGLLVPYVYSVNRPTTQYRLGVIPHYRDADDPAINQLINRYPDEILRIDVLATPQAVVNAISSCDHIVSSSLHGLIVADTLQIPSGWIVQSSNVTGDGFKFHDYGSSVNRTMIPHRLIGTESLNQVIDYTTPPPTQVTQTSQQLHDLALNLTSYLLKNNQPSTHRR